MLFNRLSMLMFFVSFMILFLSPSHADANAVSENTERFSRLGTTPMTDTKTFEAFGGREGLVKIMDDFMVLLIADPRTKPFFDNPKQAHIKAMLVEQVCEILNGGCTYTGLDMKSSHANMKVNRAAFNALVENFQVAMDKNQVPFRAQNKLLAKLAPMYREIETTTGDAIPPTTLGASK